MSDLPPHGLSAHAAIEKIRDGWLSSTEIVTDCIDRIEQTDGQVKAWAHIDRDYALAQAAELDAIRQNGKPMGPLHGVPVGLKDIVDTKHLPTERGTSVFSGRQPSKDAFLVNRLREAGAVILGKTVTSELAFVSPGETRNPLNPEHTPGGSSSGSAAAVASYQVPLAIGTQTNGSVIRPASFCGIYGLKPTQGIISRTGLLKTSESFDQVGVFARELEDAALLVDVIGAYDPDDLASYAKPRPNFLSGARREPPIEPNFAWFEMPYADQYEPEVAEGFEELIELLGERVERIKPADSFAGLIETQKIIHLYEISRHLDQDFKDHWTEISPALQALVEEGRETSEEVYNTAIAAVHQTKSFFKDFFRDYDCILTPSALGEAPLFSEGHTGNPVCCTLWTLAGLPCLNLPLLTGKNGLAVGVQLVGAQEEDDRLMRTANWLLKQL